jgi:hypothetical protein
MTQGYRLVQRSGVGANWGTPTVTAASSARRHLTPIRTCRSRSGALVNLSPDVSAFIVGKQHATNVQTASVLQASGVLMTSRKELHPTGLVPEALSAQVLNFMNQGKLGLLELAAAADVVAAECRHNYWVLNEVKKTGVSEEQFMRLLNAFEVVHDRCCAAMAAFDAGGTRETLRSELAEVAGFLNNHTL